jgi:hypothetical protein
MCSEKIINLAAAMLKVQKIVRPAMKDKINSFTQSRYATLNSVMEALMLLFSALLTNLYRNYF